MDIGIERVCDYCFFLAMAEWSVDGEKSNFQR